MTDILVTEEFLDTYEGEVMFLSQDLEDLAKGILTADFSQEELDLLKQNMLDVHDVFLSSSYTQHIAPIFEEFSEFIASVSLEKLMESEDTISYLYDIVSDVNSYINQYFVDRSFSDVYLFQDSLKNSIEFLKSSYNETDNNKDDEDGSEVFFLND